METFRKREPYAFHKEKYDNFLIGLYDKFGSLDQIQKEIYDEKSDYFNEVGCCLVCSVETDDCWCYECKCKKCFWYDEDEYLNEKKCYLGEGV